VLEARTSAGAATFADGAALRQISMESSRRKRPVNAWTLSL
jgi:hypothetical protein